MHRYNAFYYWKKWHNKQPIVVDKKPQYFVWYQGEWVEVNMETCMAAMMEKRPWAITKPRNVQSKQKGD